MQSLVTWSCKRERSMVISSDHLVRLDSREAYEQFRERARAQWSRLWEGDDWVVSVGVGSSSIAKGALKVLEACKVDLPNSVTVREVSGNGAFWMEPWIEVKRPGEPPVIYGNVSPQDVPAVVSGHRQELAVAARG